MRIAILVACALATSAVANDDLAKTTTCETNGQRVVTVDTHTRAGSTNLTVKTIVRQDEGKTYRIQNVYRNGKIVLEITELGFGICFSTKPQTDCNVGTHFTADGRLDNVNLMDTNLMILDHFTVTNGVLCPISSAEIKKANAIGADIKTLFDPEHIRQVTPEQFGREAVELKRKHQKE